MFKKTKKRKQQKQQQGKKMAKKEFTIDDIVEKLSVLISPLTPEQQERLLKSIKVQYLTKNEVVYSEGDTPTDMLCLISGKLKIYKEGVSGRSQLIRALKPVSFTGYRAYFANELYLTACTALEESAIIRIPLNILVEIIQQNAALGWFFIKELSTRLGSANERTVNLTQKHVRGRLAETLLFLRDIYGLEADGCTLSIYLSREDMAGMSNMTTSNAIRTLSAFAQEKLIAIDGRKIKLIEIKALERISQFG